MDAITASTFASGTGFAARIRGSAPSICLLLAALLASAGVAAQPASAADLRVEVKDLRNARGVLRVCLTRDSRHFPDCSADPHAIARSIPAKDGGHFEITGVPPGTYALCIFHDANGNGRLDTFLAIPREGFGFSRNPKIRMGPPRFDETRFDVSGAISLQTVVMRYML